MGSLAYVKFVLSLLVRPLRTWFELGGRLERIEDELARQTARSDEQLERIRDDLSAFTTAQSQVTVELQKRMLQAERLQSERLATMDRAVQERIDEWARQLSGQINQLYLSVSGSPARTGR